MDAVEAKINRETPARLATSAKWTAATWLSSSLACGSNSAVGSFDSPPTLMTAPQSSTWAADTSRMSSSISSTRSR